MALSAPEGMKLIDTCVNLQDSMFQGIYNGKQKHEPDFDHMIQRAAEHGVEKIIGVSGSLSDSEHSISVANKFPNIFATVGVHPTRCGEFDENGNPDAHLAALAKLVDDGRKQVVAIGEIGLDYDREEFCGREVQQKYFVKQLALAKRFNLPVVFHNRNTSGDFEKMVRENRDEFRTGIVHSFTGTLDEMKELVGLGLYMGINGCGLKTAENCEVVKNIPLDRLVLETDAPWCGIRNSHASSGFVKTKFEEVKKEKFVAGKMVKDRCEAAHTLLIAEVVAGLKGVSVAEVAEATYANTKAVLFAPPE